MFMLRRRRRAQLTKSLLKLRRKTGGDEAAGAGAAVAMLLKKLQDNQLEMLLRAVERRGAVLPNCVLMSREFDLHQPHVVFCRTWRWPDLRHGAELRQMPCCRSAYDPIYICCNPYHWSRLCLPESPPPPYSRDNDDRIRPEDRAPSELTLLYRDSYSGSVTTIGDSNIDFNKWCLLAYWELRDRVGEVFSVESPAVNIFGKVPYGDGVPCGDGVSLTLLATRHDSTSSKPLDSILRARGKIGQGVTLSREDNCVWVYNRSEHPIFVYSLCLENGSSAPIRLPADYCLCVFDPDRTSGFVMPFSHPTYGPVDTKSIRISFAKGWGQGYSRREITSCPCWLEVLLLSPCR